MELLYIVLLGLIGIQVAIFLLLQIPSPTGWKGSVAETLSRNRKIQIVMLALLAFCLIAGLLFADCYRMENKYRAQRDFLIQNKNVGTEIRISQLSYKMLLVQRNKYISFMSIFITVFVNIYISLLRYMYSSRDAFELRKAESEKRSTATSGVTAGGHEEQPKKEA